MSAQFHHTFSIVSAQFQHKFSIISAQFQQKFSTISAQSQHNFSTISAQFQQNFSTVSTHFQQNFRCLRPLTQLACLSGRLLAHASNRIAAPDTACVPPISGLDPMSIKKGEKSITNGNATSSTSS